MPCMPAGRVVACGLLVIGAFVLPRSSPADTLSSFTGNDAAGSLAVIVTDSLRHPTSPEIHTGATSTPSVRTLSFTPHRLDRCRYFVILEASGSKIAIQTQDQGDQFLVSHAFGLMKNLDRNWSVGAAVEAHWSFGFVKFTPAVRARRWFGKEQSVEGSLGYVAAHASRDYGGEMIGPVASVRYSPTPLVFAQAGVSGFRHHDVTYFPASGLVIASTRDETRAFGGVGFASGYGLVIMGAELVTLGVLAALFAGMS